MAREVAISRPSDPLDLVHELRGIKERLAPIDVERIAAVFESWSANSRRAFRSDLSLWSSWCSLNRVAALQACPSDVACWVRELAAGQGVGIGKARSSATIKRYLVSVGRAYRLLRLVDPTDDELVKSVLKTVRTEIGVQQKQALGLRFKGDVADLDGPPAPLSLVTLLKAARRGRGRLDALALRNIAMLRVNYDTGLRSAELVRIQVQHIEGPNADGAGSLFVPTSKTDREGEGAYAYLSPATMAAIADWMLEARFKAGPLFCRITTHFDGTVDKICKVALHPNSVGRIYKGLVRVAHKRGLLGVIGESKLKEIVDRISSHSIRVGVAQDNFAAEEDLGAIMQAYRWKDPRTVLRYGEKLAVRSGASARMAKRFEV